MITRFYVDNYKCLVNFEYEPTQFELIVGANGSGKSTVFEALTLLRDFVLFGVPVDQCFPESSLNRWKSSEVGDLQTFRIYMDLPNPYDLTQVERIEYILHIQHDLNNKKAKVLNEFLFKKRGEYQDVLFSFMDGKIYFHRDDSSEMSSFPALQSRSALGIMPEQEDNRRLIAFREALYNLTCVHLNPMQMEYASENETAEASPEMSNFPAWYRHFSQQDTEGFLRLTEDLREVLPDFDVLQLRATGSQRRELWMKPEGGKESVAFRFDELSDGQRTLIVLYAILNFSVGKGKTICIDEPENFVSSRELQPWLMLLQERIEEFGGQAILISHHPEFINALAPQDAIQFRRNNGGPVMIRPFETKQFEGLTPAEIVARGWDNE